MLLPRLLIVDDDPQVSRMLRRMVAGSFAIDVATSASEALARIGRGERFHAILCDITLGNDEMSGRDFYDLLIERSFEQSLRVVVYTGTPFLPDDPLAVALDDRFFVKNQSVALLVSKLLSVAAPLPQRSPIAEVISMSGGSSGALR